MHNIRMISVAFGGLLIQKWTMMERWSLDLALEGYAILT